MDQTPRCCDHCGLPVPRSRCRAAIDAPVYCCYGCNIAHALARAAESPGSAALTGVRPNTLLLRLGLGVFLVLNMMAINALLLWRHVYDAGETGGAAAELQPLAGLAAYLLLFMATIVVAALGIPMAADAIGSVRRIRLDSNLLIVLGAAAAYILSACNTFRGDSHLYFDTAALILVLVTLGQYLDSLARTRAASATRDLLAALPARVIVERDGVETDIPVSEVRVGDAVRVRSGETIPVDGQVIDGAAHVNEADLTGESIPRAVAPGTDVLAGSINTDGQLRIRVRSVGADLAIARMQRLLEDARLRQPPIQRLADRLAGAFIPGVVALAVATAAFHAWRGRPVDGLLNGLSVLLISCPCALGMAVPLATWTALGRAARRGILIDSGATLERAAAVRKVYFDKTGTLTRPELILLRIEPPPDAACSPSDQAWQGRALTIAAALESAHTHPIARAILGEANRRALLIPTAVDARVIPGLGVSAAVDGVAYRLGSRKLVMNAAPDQPDPGDALRIYLAGPDGPLAVFVLGEEMRTEAPDVVESLRRSGLQVEVLTGDQPGPAQRLARELGVTVHDRLLPTDKVAVLEAARTARARSAIAMVGDGINDAPVLAAADVGFAVGAATDLARQAGNIHLTADSLHAVPITLAIARQTMWRIRFNLFWAFAYNTIGLGLAAAGLLNPVLAALAMICSSLLIVITSRSAGRIEPE